MLRNKSFSCHIGFEIHPAPPASGGGGGEMTATWTCPATRCPKLSAFCHSCRSLRLHSGTSGRGSARSLRAYATAPLTRLAPASGGLLDGTADHTKAKMAGHESAPVAGRRTAAHGVVPQAAALVHRFFAVDFRGVTLVSR
jgi:hypothetical protein